MYHITIVTEDKNKFKPLVRGFEDGGNCHIHWNASVDAALKTAADSPPHLLILDEKIGQLDCLALARQVILTNAMLNQALVSPLSTEDFHQASEGLGVMAQLTPDLTPEHAHRLIQLLDQMP